jgi:hypothetical protein
MQERYEGALLVLNLFLSCGAGEEREGIEACSTEKSLASGSFPQY